MTRYAPVPPVALTRSHLRSRRKDLLLLSLRRAVTPCIRDEVEVTGRSVLPNAGCKPPDLGLRPNEPLSDELAF